MSNPVVLQVIENMHVEYMVRNFKILSYEKEGDKMVIKWAKRPYPLSDEELEERGLIFREENATE